MMDFLSEPWFGIGLFLIGVLSVIFKDEINAKMLNRAGTQLFYPKNLLRKGAPVAKAWVIQEDKIPQAALVGKDKRLVGSSIWYIRITDLSNPPREEYVWIAHRPDVAFQKTKMFRDLEDYMLTDDQLQDFIHIERLVSVNRSLRAENIRLQKPVAEVAVKQAEMIGKIRKETGPSVLLPNKYGQQGGGHIGEQPISTDGAQGEAG
ncbi:MAG: hypothetical protein WC350_05955 [Candidatus Micrarchaeia archaeon]|jgi:hypothetical protein